MEEIIKQLEDSLTEENTDVKKYEEMAAMLRMNGHTDYAQIISDIAAEEATHAKHLHNILAEVAHK